MSPSGSALHHEPSSAFLLNSTLPSSDTRGTDTSTQDPIFISYIAIGLLGAFIWDVISNIGYDYKLLKRWPIEKPAAVYVISRIATLCSTLFWVIFCTTTAIDCMSIIIIERCSFPIALSTTTLLLFFRVRALYRDSPLVIAFFFVTWLCVVIAATLETIVDNATKIHQSTGTCVIKGKDGPFIAAGAIAPLINDILVYCAIARGLLRTTHVDEPDLKKTIKVVVFGHHLSTLAKTFLQDGQIYLLALIPTYTTTIVMFSLKPDNLSYSVLTTFPTIVIANLMIGKIYRRMRLGLDTATSNVEPSRPLIFNSFRLSPSISTEDDMQHV